jgi:hypothetical protein
MRATPLLYASSIILCANQARGADTSLAEGIRDLNTNVSAAFQMTHLKYEEPSNTEAFNLPNQHTYLDKESGTPVGVRLSASWMGEKEQHGIYASLLYSRVSSDDITYTGHYQDVSAADSSPQIMSY